MPNLRPKPLLAACLLLLTMTLIAPKWLHKTSRLCLTNCAWHSSMSSTLRNTSSAAPAQ